MTFENLPADWNERPLWELNLCDVVDLLVGEVDRWRESLCLMIADDQGIAHPSPLLFSGVDWSEPPPPGGGFDRILDPISQMGPHLVVAFGHREPGVTFHDLRWRSAIEKLLPAHGLRALGFFSADPDRVAAIGDASAFVA